MFTIQSAFNIQLSNMKSIGKMFIRTNYTLRGGQRSEFKGKTIKCFQLQRIALGSVPPMWPFLNTRP